MPDRLASIVAAQAQRIAELEREAFEQWCNDLPDPVDTHQIDGVYTDDDAATCWFAWQARASLPATQPAAPGAEAVAWLFTCKRAPSGGSMQYATIDENDSNHWPLTQWREVIKTPLYATPPASPLPPLTDAQIDAAILPVIESHRDRPHWERERAVARAGFALASPLVGEVKELTPMTDEQIMDAIETEFSRTGEWPEGDIAIARIVERHHGIAATTKEADRG